MSKNFCRAHDETAEGYTFYYIDEWIVAKKIVLVDEKAADRVCSWRDEDAFLDVRLWTSTPDQQEHANWAIQNILGSEDDFQNVVISIMAEPTMDTKFLRREIHSGSVGIRFQDGCAPFDMTGYSVRLRDEDGYETLFDLAKNNTVLSVLAYDNSQIWEFIRQLSEESDLQLKYMNLTIMEHCDSYDDEYIGEEMFIFDEDDLIKYLTSSEDNKIIAHIQLGQPGPASVANIAKVVLDWRPVHPNVTVVVDVDDDMNTQVLAMYLNSGVIDIHFLGRTSESTNPRKEFSLCSHIDQLQMLRLARENRYMTIHSHLNARDSWDAVKSIASQLHSNLEYCTLIFEGK